MADYNISAQITADTKGFESGVKKAQTASKELSKSITNVVKGFGKSGLSGAITSAGLALGGIGLAVGVATKAIKGMVKALDECAEAYKVQLNAERALDTAINNSPYVTGTASKRLKEFASEMQRTSNMGDEEIIPFMTQLIASGRTEAETMKIIKTASDMASSGAMSFDSAVTQLNATLNGNIGRLGQQNAELKELTEEELKNGKAVDILAEKYKGLTEATVDTKKQLKNAIGDLKESLGKSFEEAMTPMRKFFTELIQGWADARKARQEYEDARKAFDSGIATDTQLITYYEQQLKYIADEKMMYEGMYGADEEYAKAELKRLALEENKYKSLIATLKYKIKLTEENTAIVQAEEEAVVETLEEEEIKYADIASWEDKLLKQNIERLEVMKDIELKGTSSASKQYAIEYKYGQKILDLKLKQLEIERDKELAKIEGTENAEEARLRILEYYAEQERLLRIKSKDPAQKTIEETINESKKPWKEIAKNITGIMIKAYTEVGKVAKGIKDTIQSVAQGIGKILKEVGSMFKNGLSVLKSLLFLDIDDSLNKILEFEDRVLTFFTETLPKLPSYVASVLQSISVLLDNLIQNVDGFQIADLVSDMVTNLLKALPDLIAKLIKAGSGIISGIVQGISEKLPDFTEKIGSLGATVLTSIKDFITNDLPVIIKAGTEIVKGLIGGISEKFPDFVETLGTLVKSILKTIQGTIKEDLPAIVNAGSNIITSLLKTLTELLPDVFDTLESLEEAIMPAIKDIIDSVVKFLVSFMKESTPLVIQTLFDVIGIVCKELPEIIKGIIETLPVLIDSIIKGLIQFFSDGLPDLINGIIDLLPTIFSATGQLAYAIIKAIPLLITALVEGICKMIEGLTAEDIVQIIKSIVEMIGLIAKSLIESVGLIVTKLVPALFEIIVGLIKKIPDILVGLGKGFIEGVGTIAKNIGEGIKSVGKAVSGWFVDLFTGKLFANGTNSAPKGLAIVGEAGPELVDFRGGEKVYSNKNSQKMLVPQGAGNTFNVTFNNLQDTSAYAMMSQLRAYNRQLSINGVI